MLKTFPVIKKKPVKHQDGSDAAATEAVLQDTTLKGPAAGVTQQDDNAYCKSTDPTACCFIFLHGGQTDLLYFSPFFFSNRALHESARCRGYQPALSPGQNSCQSLERPRSSPARRHAEEPARSSTPHRLPVPQRALPAPKEV